MEHMAAASQLEPLLHASGLSRISCHHHTLYPGLDLAQEPTVQPGALNVFDTPVLAPR